MGSEPVPKLQFLEQLLTPNITFDPDEHIPLIPPPVRFAH
jgi:hypothetical protein